MCTNHRRRLHCGQRRAGEEVPRHGLAGGHDQGQRGAPGLAGSSKCIVAGKGSSPRFLLCTMLLAVAPAVAGCPLDLQMWPSSCPALYPAPSQVRYHSDTQSLKIAQGVSGTGASRGCLLHGGAGALSLRLGAACVVGLLFLIEAWNSLCCGPAIPDCSCPCLISASALKP